MTSEEMVLKLFEYGGVVKLASVAKEYLGTPLKNILLGRAETKNKTYDKIKDAQADITTIGLLSPIINDQFKKGIIASYQKDGITLNINPAIKDSSELKEVREYLERVEKRISTVEIRQQESLEDIFTRTADILRTVESVNDTPINEDWMNQFISHAKDISSDEMKDIWAKVLAGEIAQPKSYSLRALNVLKNLTKEEAVLFENFSSLIIRDANEESRFVFRDRDYLEQVGFSLEKIIYLEELGFIKTQELSYIAQGDLSKKDFLLIQGELMILIKSTSNYNTISIPCYYLTKIGAELFKLTNMSSNMDYLRKLAAKIKENEGVKVSCSKYVVEGGRVGFILPLIVL
ncbi:hypothetical protein BWI93_08640 [Siphonobacter sp. BAB-5385]|uniref:DUF2806 domain-containing protein n=1 Tax=Siphonobacter sp. BAB-5385 TaxID=1864822 RepID=UPI000B9DE380|nr:DUF2806 domain-containing protein [Siphonobacter sp. BAB-5385]OZI08552.1 hypothetical protein BWI93_08640 [Siphonobacter sp. BAB-5385]